VYYHYINVFFITKNNFGHNYGSPVRGVGLTTFSFQIDFDKSIKIHDLTVLKMTLQNSKYRVKFNYPNLIYKSTYVIK
jgi:hypothetical protein